MAFVTSSLPRLADVAKTTHASGADVQGPQVEATMFCISEDRFDARKRG